MSVSYTSFLLDLQDRLSASMSTEKMTAVFYIEFGDLSYLGEFIQYLDEEQLVNNMQTKIDMILPKESLCTYANQYQFIITYSISSLKDAEIFAKHIIHTFSEPCNIDGHMFYLFTSVGISISPLETLEAKLLIHYSKMMMKQKRKEGKNLYGFSQSMDAPIKSPYY